MFEVVNVSDAIQGIFLIMCSIYMTNDVLNS